MLSRNLIGYRGHGLTRKFLLLGALSGQVGWTQDVTEEIRKEQPVGASQLVLRSAKTRAATHGPSNGRLEIRIAIPAAFRGSAVVEVRDSKDMGYYLRAKVKCTESLDCGVVMPESKVKQLGLQPADLWVLASAGEGPRVDEVFPACFCDAVSASDPVDLVFMPSRAINVDVKLYDGKSKPVFSDSRTAHAAMLPLRISLPTMPPTAGPFRLVVRHAAATGTLDRFSDTYTLSGIAEEKL